MDIPSVVICGRPNVGKSSLFNALCGSRVAIVEPTAGVTRDRISRMVESNGTVFELWDTGGMGLQDSEELADDIENQIRFAIMQADLVLFVVDARAGRQPMDRTIADELRRAEKDVILVANKCDNPRDTMASADFYELGFERVISASATHRRGIDDILEEVARGLPEDAAVGSGEPSTPQGPMKIAFVGRRNVGKSTLVNHLAQEPRVLVSEIPGTTRDAVDVRFRMDDLDFIAIDTAGLRRRKQVKDSIDFYSTVRAENSIERADVVVHVLDAPSEIGRLDKQLADQITSNYKPCVLAVNKFDLAPPEVTCERFREYLDYALPGVPYAPIVCVSGLTGDNVYGLIETAQVLYEQSLYRARPKEIWDIVREAAVRNPPPSTRSRFCKIHYATQVAVKPPTIVLFVNYSGLMTDSYLRYIANQLRQELPFHSVPLKLIVRARKSGRKGR